MLALCGVFWVEVTVDITSKNELSDIYIILNNSSCNLLWSLVGRGYAKMTSEVNSSNQETL